MEKPLLFENLRDMRVSPIISVSRIGYKNTVKARNTNSKKVRSTQKRVSLKLLLNTKNIVNEATYTRNTGHCQLKIANEAKSPAKIAYP
jgi:uncharacterized protein YeeX (DUF496 family)